MTKIKKEFEDYLNDGDRGPGHGIGNSLFWGFVICSIAIYFPWYVCVVLLIANHVRTFHQEWFIEEWRFKYKTAADRGDFWYDAFFRPAATDFIVVGVCFFYNFLPVFFILAVVFGWKKRNQWPLVIFWKD